MAETNDFDTIFTALKHPVRRQILVLLEEKGEASFTEIQDTVGTDDTGLISYHLKELMPLAEQTARGKYCLLEIGQTSIVLFRKVKREKQKKARQFTENSKRRLEKSFFFSLSRVLL